MITFCARLTLSFFADQEDQENEKAPSKETTDMSESSDSDDETENNDITKFLGIAKSPVVQQALQTLGLPSPSKEQRRGRNRPKKAKNPTTPTRGVSEPKVRLTYENVRNSNKNLENEIIASATTTKDNEEPAAASTTSSKASQERRHESEVESPVKRLKIDEAPAAENLKAQKVENASNEAVEAAALDYEAEAEAKKVPPLKIVWNKTKEAENDNSFNNFEYYMKKRKLRPPQTAVVRPLQPPTPEKPKPVIEQPEPVQEPEPEPPSSEPEPPTNVESSEPDTKKLPLRKRPLNDIEKYQKIRAQIEVKRKNLFPVFPKPPEGFKDYLMNKRTYLLQENAQERLRSMPLIQPPFSLKGPLRQLFIEQEKERFKLRTKHLVEKEKLVLAVEQVRVYFQLCLDSAQQSRGQK